jgi:hypothetical protein
MAQLQSREEDVERKAAQPPADPVASGNVPPAGSKGPGPTRWILPGSARLGIGLAVVALLAVAAWALLRGGELSGDVFVRLPSGEVRRGAAVTVVLYEPIAEFDLLAKQWEAEWTPAIQRYLDAARANRLPLETQIDLGRHARAVTAEYRGRAVELLRAQRPAHIARADSSGHYVISGVRSRPYMAVASYLADGILFYWAVKTEFGRGAHTLDLTNHNQSTLLTID